ncbi:MAG: hypothetical protein OXH34_03160, partial [Bacteroidetes bacterium]|nr:hypothetical protein [Bacteroidota bacterium]
AHSGCVQPPLAAINNSEEHRIHQDACPSPPVSASSSRLAGGGWARNTGTGVLMASHADGPQGIPAHFTRSRKRATLCAEAHVH